MARPKHHVQLVEPSAFRKPTLSVRIQTIKQYDVHGDGPRRENVEFYKSPQTRQISLN